ncbi:hypothetical protein HGA34_02505 [Candidatus Falkowbacteria bacterium]|nr:hypothetical protein [Candidatus Falkowbacteria bacterium]
MRISEPAIERKEDGGQPVIFDDESEYDAAMFEFFKSNRKQTAVSDLGMQEGESRINPLADFLRVAGSHIKRLFGRT